MVKNPRQVSGGDLRAGVGDGKVYAALAFPGCNSNPALLWGVVFYGIVDEIDEEAENFFRIAYKGCLDNFGLNCNVFCLQDLLVIADNLGYQFIQSDGFTGADFGLFKSRYFQKICLLYTSDAADE